MKRTPPEMMPSPFFPDVVLGDQLHVPTDAALAAEHCDAAAAVAGVGHAGAGGDRVVAAAEGGHSVADADVVALTGVEHVQDADGGLDLLGLDDPVPSA